MAAARNSSNKAAACRIETQISDYEDAIAKARQVAASRDGYRYAVTLRNEAQKAIKSIDWDYLFY